MLTGSAARGRTPSCVRWHYNGCQMATTVVEILGGKKALGRNVAGERELLPLIRSGLPPSTVKEMAAALGVSQDRMAQILALSKRTFARRRTQARLTAAESDRLYRLARITARAGEVLGSTEKAARWLQKPNRALGGEIPIGLLDTDLGAGMVGTVLGRIEHGVYS